eukprot:5946463-Pyramimonas_sp.AAC.1
MAKCVVEWEAAGLGVVLPHFGLFNHAVWADNVYFVGKSMLDVTTMFASMTREIGLNGFRWNPKSLKLLHTDTSAGQLDVVVHVDGQDHQVECVAEMEVLGNLLAPLSDHVAAAKHRLAKASSAFWSHSSYYLCRHIHIQKRMA